MNTRRRLPKLRTVAIATAVAIAVAIALWQRCGLRGCPNVDQLAAYQPGNESVLYDANGRRFDELKPIEHQVVKLASLPDYLPAAFVAVEDKRFYEHNGVDHRRVLGALAADIKAMGFVQGFSTITMQIGGTIWRDKVKRTKKTIGRKFVEIRLAREIEKKYTKEEILELYLNNVYFGGGAYGVEAAARNYFRKPATDLTMAQAAMLAALPKSPTIYDPRRSGDRAKRRRDLVISLMAEQGRITAEQAERAQRERLSARRDPAPRRNESGVAPYFAEAVRRVLEDRFGEELYTAPLRIYTTLDRTAQRAAEEELSRQLRSIENGAFGRYRGKRYASKEPPGDETRYVQGAALVMNAQTGAVLAHVGGRDFKQSRFDRATRAKRQAGSAFKPFVFAAALSEGYAPSQHIKDDSMTMELPGGEIWQPRNFTGDFAGEVTLRQALVASRNIPTIRLAATVGLNDVARVARLSGIRSTIDETPAMPIGTAAVTPLELARSYTTFATLGTTVQPRWIDRVEDADGNLVWKPEVTKSEVLDGGVAYLVTDMLREAVSRGTGTAVRNTGYRGPAAGKTGTTNDGADVWFVGYTPRHVAAVWIGFDDPAPIVSNASGGRIAAPVWGRIMRRIYATRATPQAWERPESIVERRVDPATGLLLPDGCRPRRGNADDELFLKYAQPASACPRGKPEHEPNIFDRAFAWVRVAWHQTGEWIASHFGEEEERREPEREPYLGVPRLPAAAEMPLPLVDTTIVLPEGFDSLMTDTLLIMPDTMPTDTIYPDTLPPDTIQVDTLQIDTLNGAR
ncbi:MAG: transglycosylase domain-containing protein [Gemmatimonadota bacterium]